MFRPRHVKNDTKESRESFQRDNRIAMSSHAIPCHSNTFASPPCAPTPGHSIQVSGSIDLTRCNAAESVPPTTTPRDP
jgi:hypothetical protein